jgi:diphthine synthase
MVLYLVGLGLGDEKDITVKGLETVRKCSKVYLEHYTSILGVGKERLVRSSILIDSVAFVHSTGYPQEAFYEREVILADREMVESEAEALFIEPARTEDIGVLVVGDPFG